MIDTGYLQNMARYNQWQNEKMYAVANGLPDAERRKDRRAFFGSIHATLNHLLWADQIWMSRFAGTPKPIGGIPESLSINESWDDLKRNRTEFDDTIIRWADNLDPRWLAGDLTWFSGLSKRDVTRPKSVLVLHFFNHQTHHRGQVHCMLTQAGVKAHVTDLMAMPTMAECEPPLCARCFCSWEMGIIALGLSHRLACIVSALERQG